ncbi:sensor histidine kinase [Acanthopleuribacter pedis]|uniref:Histidine kinase n=1 Tax=Acanthopleuribacter pedis TaxID=442870 RepID=A0A8J7QNF9_9BACT|nr:sensor histidine kinase [Acanthopleuribacter pedis]MBO1321250.1 histidine kinase [Acanthopleuribacter pedis]
MTRRCAVLSRIQNRSGPAARRIICVTGCLLWLWCDPLWAQRLAFENLSVAQGLPQSSVQTLLQDRNGFLWFGTPAGVRRYDGHQFQNPFADRPQIPLNARYLTQDNQDRIWIATNRGALCWDNGSITYYRGLNYRKNVVVNHILEGRYDELWFATDTGLSVLTPFGQFEHYPKIPGAGTSRINAVWQDENSVLTVGTDAGLVQFEGSQFRPAPVWMTVPPVRVNRFADDGKDTLWVATAAGLYAVRHNQTIYLGGTDEFGGDDIRALTYDPAGFLWLGHENGACRITLDPQSRLGSVHKLTTANGLHEGMVYQIQPDREGRWWFATHSGVSKLNNMVNFSFTGPQNLGLDVWSIAQPEPDSVWLGTGAGVRKLDLNQLNQPAAPWPGNRDLKNDEIRALLTTPDGWTWIGTRHGLWRTRVGWARAEPFPLQQDGDDVFVRHLLRDNLGRLWVATDRRGVLRISGDDWEIIRDLGPKQGLPGQRVFCLYQTRDTRLWFGTENGLACLDGELEISRLRVIDEDRGLPYNRVLSLVEDNRDRLWLGTGFGLAVMIDNQFERIGHQQGLQGSAIHFLVWHQPTASLWIGHNEGLSRLQNNAFRHFNRRHGLAYEEMNANAVWLDHNDMLWVGCRKGVNRMNPHIEQPAGEPPVFITAFVSDDRNLALDTHNVLDHDQNFLRIEFSGLNYSRPDMTRFRVKLDGFDADWREIDSRSVQYAGLPSGRYTFLVKAGNENGAYLGAPAELSFTIEPPIWMRPWFIGILLFSIILLVWRRLTDLKEDNEKLALETTILQKRVEKEKEIELRQEAEIRLLHSQMNPHFLQNALNTAIYFAGNNPEKAKRILRKLSQIFRMNHKATLDGWSTMGAEIRLIDSYMEIQLLRFPDKLTYNSVCPQDLHAKKIPGFIIQPLVENACVHGVKNTLDAVHVSLNCALVDGSVHVSVANNGQPLRRPFSACLSDDHALGNINKRLKLLYNQELQYNYEEGNLIFSFHMRHNHESDHRG